MTFPLRQSVVRFSCLALLVSILGLAGCAGKGDVSGVVKYKGQPLKFGTVTFSSVSGGPVSAEIQPDGSYKAPGVPTGTAQVTVSAIDPGVTQYFKDLSASSKAGQKGEGGAPKPKGDPKSFYVVPEKYSDAGLSGLSFDVKSGQNTYDIDLK